jgi:AraC-like DNA-binding protein
MRLDTISGHPEQTQEDRRVGITTGVWSFQQLRISFGGPATTVNPRGQCDSETGLCRMLVCLKGDLRLCMAGIGKECDFFVPSGNCSLHYHPGYCSSLDCLDCGHNDRQQFFELVCPARTFVELAEGTRVGRELAAAVDTELPLQILQPMTPEIHRVLISLQEALPESGGAATLVIAKSMEILWFFTQAQDETIGLKLSMDTCRAVGKACSILENMMADPPSLDSLAARVGMSLSKFKQVFSFVYGMPPYAYLRLLRMERAKHLLSARKMSVTESAFEVGYSNLSHFAKIFAAHYGIKPSQARHGC